MPPLLGVLVASLLIAATSFAVHWLHARVFPRDDEGTPTALVLFAFIVMYVILLSAVAYRRVNPPFAILTLMLFATSLAYLPEFVISEVNYLTIDRSEGMTHIYLLDIALLTLVGLAPAAIALLRRSSHGGRATSVQLMLPIAWICICLIMIYYVIQNRHLVTTCSSLCRILLWMIAAGWLVMVNCDPFKHRFPYMEATTQAASSVRSSSAMSSGPSILHMGKKRRNLMATRFGTGRARHTCTLTARADC